MRILDKNTVGFNQSQYFNTIELQYFSQSLRYIYNSKVTEPTEQYTSETAAGDKAEITFIASMLFLKLENPLVFNQHFTNSSS